MDTQDGNVKLLQEEYNGYYESKSRKYIEIGEEINRNSELHA